MNPHKQEDHGPSNLLIDPSIWHSPRRRLQTGLVRSLISSSPPPPANSRLPSYIRDGLALKHARRQSNNDTIVSRLPSPPSDSRFSTEEANPFGEVAVTQVDTGPSSSSHSRVQGTLSDSPDEFSPQNVASTSWEPRPNAKLHQPPLSYIESPPESPLSFIYTQDISQGSSPHGQTGRSTPYDTQLDSSSYTTSSISASNQSTRLSALAPAFTSHKSTQSIPQARLEQIMQSNSWRTPRSSAAAEASLATTAIATTPPPLTTTTAGAPARSSWTPSPASASSSTRQHGPKQRTSANYRGDPTNPNNQSADIPEEDNTSVFIENLPPDATAREVLLHLRGTGKIYALSVGAPTARIPTSCAKIVYWDRRGVDRLLLLRAGGKFVLHGHDPIVKLNWHKTAPQPASSRSRVIVVEGPSRLVNQTRLDALFAVFFTWDTDEVLVHWQREGRTRLEYRFASHRAQASEAYRRITQAANRSEDGLPEVEMSPEEKTLWKEVRVRWGKDPCE